MPDFYAHPEYYGTGNSEADAESVRALQAIRRDPDGTATVYRAVPPGVETINPGDWVTLSPTYARQHGFDADDPEKDWPVISMEVPARSLYTDGNSVNELGYDPSGLSRPVATVPRSRLAKLPTADLIAQYQLAISSSVGRYSNTAPRQRRINYIVDLLSDRADAGDAAALAWYDKDPAS